MMHAVIKPYDGFVIKSKNEKFWWFFLRYVSLCLISYAVELTNFCAIHDACIDWSICYLSGESHCVYPGWTIIIEIFWPITTIHSYTFLLGGSIERAWLGDLTLLNWLLAAQPLWLAGFLVMAIRFVEHSGFLWISEYLALVVLVGMWGMSGELMQARWSLCEGGTLLGFV